MIKINLLPQKRAKRAAKGARGASVARAQPSGDSGVAALLIGIGALVAAGAIAFFVLDLPQRAELADLKIRKDALTKEVNTKRSDPKFDLASFDALNTEKAEAVKKIASIQRLVANRIVPANILHELGQILQTRGPTMTERMAKATEKDQNKKFQNDWDPTHVWLSSYKDLAGLFTIEGGAQSKEDVTQLSKRLAASVYFNDVTPQGGEQVNDRDSGLAYYKFTITGKVAY